MPLPPIELYGSFESVYQPEFDVDVAENTGHVARWREDLEKLKLFGVTSLRYPIRWHRVEAEEGSFDWRHTDVVLGWMRDNGMRPVVDLVHHTSHPRWLTAGLADPRFGPALLRFCEQFARRYPWVPGYTVFNEPFTTFFLCGSEAVFPPHLSGMEGFISLVRNVFPAVTEVTRMYRDLLPGARHFNVDTCERHSAATPAAAEYTVYANDRRFFMTDLMLGAYIDHDRPFIRDIIAAGGEDLLSIGAGHIDVLGLDYYAHSQWRFWGPGTGSGTSPVPGRLDDLIVEYWERYRLPCMLGETNIRGYPSDRASWFKYTLEQCENARGRGVPMEGYCWFPFIDSCDWNSLLRRADRAIDPVGVLWLGNDLERHESTMSHSFRLAARGTCARDLPAYRFRRPVADWVAGYAEQMAHWNWLDPPGEPVCTNAPAPDDWVAFDPGPVAPEPAIGNLQELTAGGAQV
ncbi:MAG: family 1 glycosylhydrolase [Candidatus Dormibacteria bacterium]